MELIVVQDKIYNIRNQQVMLDFDLAEMYDIQTRRLKEQVRRNIERFPVDFMFQLTKAEWFELVAICDKFPEKIKHSPATPFAFTQEGVAMLSGVLRSPLAVQENIGIMRAFVAVRKYLVQASYPITIEDRVRMLEEANEELLKDMNDLSEDTRNALDEMFDAFANLTNKLNISKLPRNPIGYTVGK